MRPSDIKQAEQEAKRFLDRVKDLRESGALPQVITKESNWGLCGSAGTGAVRRASLDLTRALAKMRAS